MVAHIFRESQESELEVYLVDFNGMSPPDMEVARREFKFLAELLSALGLRESLSKAVGPGTSVVLRGISFDTVKMTMEVTPDRVQEILVLADSWFCLSSLCLLCIVLRFGAVCLMHVRVIVQVARLIYFMPAIVGMSCGFVCCPSCPRSTVCGPGVRPSLNGGLRECHSICIRLSYRGGDAGFIRVACKNGISSICCTMPYKITGLPLSNRFIYGGFVQSVYACSV